MALGKSYSSKLKCSGLNASNVDVIDEDLVLAVHCTRAVGRKRIVVSNCVAIETFPLSSHFRTPSKKHREMKTIRDNEKSLLEALPQDILVRVLCCVYHDDLKQLIQVSKLIRDATLIAKQSHFAYSTPRAKITGLRTSSGDLENDTPEAPNAPRQQRFLKSRISKKKLSDISVALFHSPEDERW